MDEVIRPKSVFVMHDRSLEEYIRWLNSQAREELTAFLGITEVAEIEKEKAMNTPMDELVQQLERNTTKQIRPGDSVRDAVTKEYLGKVLRVETVNYAHIQTKDGDGARVNMARIETAPKLTPEQAWSQLPLDIVKELAALKESPFNHSWGGATSLYASGYTDLRRQCYVLLGGTGVKVTEEVKGRVRSIIETLAGHLGIRIV